MKEVTVKNYQELAMRTCLPSAKNWEYCYCLIASEIGEAFGKWGKKFRDGEFDKDKLTDELGDVFWGIALACELGGESFFDIWQKEESWGFHCASVKIDYHLPNIYREWMYYGMKKNIEILSFIKTFAEECGIDPLDCLRRNIAKLAGRKERGTLGGNGDNR